MFPTKNASEYIGEASWFSPQNGMDADLFLAYNSPFPIAHRYSSSTDSTSPESYFNTPIQLTQSTQYSPWSDTQSNDSKLGYRMVYDSLTQNNLFESSNSDNNAIRFNNNRNFSYFGHQQYVNSPTKQYPVFDSQNYDQNQICNTPVKVRAIVGRKVFESDNTEIKSENIDYCIRQPKGQETNHTQYELFPSSEHNFGCTQKESPDLSTNCMFSPSPMMPSPNLSQNESFPYSEHGCTPKKKSTDLSTNSMFSLSPLSNFSQNTSQLSGMFHAEQTPSTSRFQYTENLSPKYANPVQYNDMLLFNSFNNISYDNSDNKSVTSNSTFYSGFKTPYKPSLRRASSTSSQAGMPLCTFCRKNGESSSVYLDHCVKEKIGNKYKVTCPILRALVCQTCGASGDNAHTITYCPVLRKTNNGKPLQSTTVTLKSTRLKSDGTKRNK
ncbi:uncharacterized protein LOC112048276 [Bicyclus anynana]|uniref:Uncharacterized protein LOC112048276 n=1 Tax=Bicyclus anynana TaxID=110368 RepID=A0A6J1N3R5_BICAN|nr:uncharacterized protein LOC112048276 [Bicyclus anynana]